MPEAIKGLFFTDRLRSIVSTLVLCGLLIAVVGQWIMPKKVKLDQESVEVLQQVVTKMERAADLFEQQGKSTNLLNETLKRQLVLQENDRRSNYGKLYELYGKDLDPSIPPLENLGVDADGHLTLDRWVFPETDDLRGHNVPRGKVPADPSTDVRAPASNGKAVVDKRATGTSDDERYPAQG